MTDKKHGTNGAKAAPASPQWTKAGKAKAGMTKWDAVKKTIEELGWDAMPLAIKDHLKKKHGIEITAHVASNYKKKLKKMAREAAGTAAAKPAAPAAPVASPAMKTAALTPTQPSAKKAAAPKPQAKSPAPAPAARTQGGNGSAGDALRLQDVLLAKELLDRVGAGPLRTLLDGLAK